MPIKTETVQFRCAAELKQRLRHCLPLLGARTVSQGVRSILEAAITNPAASALWVPSPGLKESATQLDRIAGALHRCLLEGKQPEEVLEDLRRQITQLRELLNGKTN
ncbi:hypothetical protein [Magnetospirillum sp. UT-4]|uniref:hypothetical protein n=1 Tax=Magnetospirillum sp. UT-4 TaxID=2681467 RepID=UPI001384D4C0|nr:hypothetical protein [Magnetospirillum sp. UT-4]CAA7625033.1 hypothetical protein MTBUT4_620005 [Magnetospirillum sp. UT-4]